MENGKFKQFATYSELEMHWADDCLLPRFACDKCDAEIAKKERAQHECMERLVFNRDEHFQYTKEHQDNILKAHLGNKRLNAISVGEGDEIEKEPLLCGKGHKFM